MTAKLAFLLNLVADASAEPIQDLCAQEAVSVETVVFSGTPNPVFTLDGASWQQICSVLADKAEKRAIPTCRAVGFTGWKVCSPQSRENCVVLRGNPKVDEVFLREFVAKVPELAHPVRDHIFAELTRLHSSNGGDVKCAHADVAPTNMTGACTAPIRGSDDPSTVHFDPQHDDQGCFVTKQSDNNCYDYANDIVTNTFAQPGRGSGVCPPNKRPCVKNTCDAVKNAAVSDGLKWVGNELPTELPSQGHYVSLHIWPNSNFHWIRMDANKYWSHKPGGTAVKNHDNNGNVITDPSKADFSPWTEHCGYMLATPSKGNIAESVVEGTVVV